MSIHEHHIATGNDTPTQNVELTPDELDEAVRAYREAHKDKPEKKGLSKRAKISIAAIALGLGAPAAVAGGSVLYIKSQGDKMVDAATNPPASAPAVPGTIETAELPPAPVQETDINGDALPIVEKDDMTVDNGGTPLTPEQVEYLQGNQWDERSVVFDETIMPSLDTAVYNMVHADTLYKTGNITMITKDEAAVAELYELTEDILASKQQYGMEGRLDTLVHPIIDENSPSFLSVSPDEMSEFSIDYSAPNGASASQTFPVNVYAKIQNGKIYLAAGDNQEQE